MADDRTVIHRYAHPPERVLALLLDPEFVAERSRAMGELEVAVTAERAGDRVTIVNERDVRRELPGFARKLFKPVNHVIQTETWQLGGEGATGDYQLEVRGAPVTIRARFELRPTADGSEYRISYDINVRVPLIRGKLERFTYDQTVAGVKKELAYTAETLQTRLESAP